MTTFEDFNLDPDLLDGILSMGYKQATPIQVLAIPAILDGNDLIACAQTGTGKTAAFVLPILDKILSQPVGGINTLILTPTRELAMQIDQQIEGLSYYVPASSIPVYGGGDGKTWDIQLKALRQGADVVVATPGRLIAFLVSGDISFKDLKHLVLDEADKMLDMGFYEDIVRIISYLPEDRQTIMFSATMPPKIRTLANRILKADREEINIAIAKPAEGIRQLAYVVHEEQKVSLIKEVLKDEDYSSVILFASTKEQVKKLDQQLRKAGLSAKAFHSDLEQEERELIMREFRSRQLRILIGTDVLSRGIDVDNISLVMNYNPPPDPEDYVHRIGRTARAERKGTAISFINIEEQRKFFRIESLIGKEVEKVPVPEFLGPAPEYKPEERKSEGKGNRPSGGNKRKFKPKRT
jgi:ATP-dependent RNA helicase RhlE